MEVEGRLRDVVEAVGGGRGGRAGLHRRDSAGGAGLLQRGGAIQTQRRVDALWPNPQPQPHPCTQWWGAGLTRGGQDASRVGGGREEGVRVVGGRRVVGGLREAEGAGRWEGGRRRSRRWRIRLDREDLGSGPARVQHQEAGALLLRATGSILGDTFKTHSRGTSVTLEHISKILLE